MNIGELFRMCRRRWLVAISALAVVLIATVGAYVGTPNKYQSSVQMTMLNSEAVTNSLGDLGNPYLSFSQALSADVDLLTRLLTSTASAQALAAQGVTESYTAAFANNALGPFMLLTVTGPNRAHVSQAINQLVTFSQQRWYSLQRSNYAPPNSIVRLVLIAPPNTPSPVRKTKIELVGGVFIGGLVIALILVAIVDNVLENRRRRRMLLARQSRERADQVPSMR
jgi:uncharacterized protein involved in exopolysaccharide biosynthesis